MFCRVLRWVMLLCFCSPSWAQRLANPSFERFDPDGMPSGWQVERSDRWQVVGDRSGGRKGKASLGIHIRQNRTTVEVAGQSVAVEPGRVYALSGWVMLEGEVADGFRGFFRLRWLGDEENERTGWRGETTWVRETGDWAASVGTFVAPEGVRKAVVVCVGEAFGRFFSEGTIRFDDLGLRPLAGGPAVHISATAHPEVLPRDGAHQSRIRVSAMDLQNEPVPDGTVVHFETDLGTIDAWARTRNGRATGVLRYQETDLGGARVLVRVGTVKDTVRVNDSRAARLKGRIFDRKTGRPLAARVQVWLKDGRLWQTRYDRAPGFFADGTFDIQVPPGTVELTAWRGFESTPPGFEVLEVKAGETYEIALPFEPWVDLASRGWYGGETVLQVGRGDQVYRVGLEEAALIARSAGLRFALATYGWDQTFRRYDAADLNRRLSLLHSPSFWMGWNLIWPRSILGDGWVIGVQDATDLSGEMAGFEAHARVHDRRGMVSYTRPFGKGRVACGLVFDTLAGPTFDALDVMSTVANDSLAQNLWFMLLNKGYRVAGTASSGVALDVPDTPMPGRFRMYTQVEGDLNAGKLADAVKAGRNFVTSGPLLLFSVFAAGPGAELSVGGRRRATLRAWASSDPSEYLTRMELVRNGAVVESWDLPDHPRNHRIGVTLQDSVTCWYVARCYGSDSTQVALTNPIYFRSSDFEAPKPVQAVVKGTVQDTSGQRLSDAQVEVLDPLGRVIRETVARQGTFHMWVPATSRIRVRRKGYAPAVQSIFHDTGLETDLLKLCRGEQPAEMLYDWATYQAVIDRLQEVELTFQLQSE
ncbi:MAG: CehA/McbA family metallohydrolase [bacterium]|nr:CehA/McbA family metallohydrolase [bacterium]